MRLLTYVPARPLSEFVELFWLFQGQPPPHARERVLPTGTTELVINLLEDPFRVYDRQDATRFRCLGHAVITGPQETFFVIDPAQQEWIMGAHFKPGGAFPFFAPPAGELSNAHVPLDAVWGTRAGALRDQLLEATTPLARFHLLEETLLARATRSLARHPAVAFALTAFQSVPHARTVAEVSGQVGLSQRRFIELFRDEVGLTPKLYCRIRRFQEVLRCLGAGQPIQWADVALSCGYFDQAHFIHDFRAFSGLNPTAYAAHRGRHPNHVPVHD